MSEAAKINTAIKLPRPTAEEIAAITAPSEETELVDIAKPTFDFLRAKLGSDEMVSRYVSGRISNELIRISKIGFCNSFGKMDRETHSEVGRRGAAAMHEKYKAGDKIYKRGQENVRLCVYEALQKVHKAICQNKFERSYAAGQVVTDALPTIADEEIKAYAKEHPEMPHSFVTISQEAAAAAKAVGERCGVPFCKVVCCVFQRILDGQNRAV